MRVRRACAPSSTHSTPNTKSSISLPHEKYCTRCTDRFTPPRGAFPCHLHAAARRPSELANAKRSTLHNRSDTDFFVSLTPLNAFVYHSAHVPPCSHGADAVGACGFPQCTEEG